MTPYVTDTDILSLYQDGHPTVARNVLAHPTGELAVTMISVEEQLTGSQSWLRRSKTREARARIYQRFTDAVSFLSQLRIASFTEPALVRYEQLQTRLRNVGGNDLRIAAIVLEENATLVTRNLRDFKRVPGLRIEDWSKYRDSLASRLEPRRRLAHQLAGVRQRIERARVGPVAVQHRVAKPAS